MTNGATGRVPLRCLRFCFLQHIGIFIYFLFLFFLFFGLIDNGRFIITIFQRPVGYKNRGQLAYIELSRNGLLACCALAHAFATRTSSALSTTQRFSGVSIMLPIRVHTFATEKQGDRTMDLSVYSCHVLPSTHLAIGCTQKRKNKDASLKSGKLVVQFGTRPVLVGSKMNLPP